MQHIKLKKGLCVLLAAFTAVVSVSFGQLSVSAETQQGALGTQEPAISASYTDASGVVYDGNSLFPGNYNMILSVSDLHSIAHLQFSATYDESLLSFNLLGETLLSDTESFENELGGIITNRTNGEFSFFIFTTNEDLTILPDNCADLLTIGITVKGDAPVDMQNVISVNTNPSSTFIDVNYGDVTLPGDDVEFNNCYALSESEDYLGMVYPMTCDLSPDLTKYYTVSAYVGALAAPEEEYGTYPTTGATVTITLEDGTQIQAETDNEGKFVLENVPNGTYTATITYQYGFDRDFKIIVNGADIESGPETMIGIVGCNWDAANNNITSSDLSVYALSLRSTVGSDNYVLGIDIDRNGSITSSDLAICARFMRYSSSEINYKKIILTS